MKAVASPGIRPWCGSRQARLARCWTAAGSWTPIADIRRLAVACSREDLIAMKQAAARRQDLEDLRALGA